MTAVNTSSTTTSTALADRLTKIYDWVKQNISDSKPVRFAFLFYCGVVMVGFTYGVIRGFKAWVRWRSERKPLRIKNKTLEPIVNNSVDSGQLGLQVLMTGLLSGLVVATAPISVPIIIFTMKEKEEEEGEGKGEGEGSKAIMAQGGD